MSKKIKGFFEVNARGTSAAEILIYDEIDSGFFGTVNAQTISDELKSFNNLTDITVRINSPGGSVFEGVAIYNLLVDHPAVVSVHIDGLAASIASIIAMAAAPGALSMAENATMMIHDPWGIFAGSSVELRKQADLLDKIRGQLLDTYTARAGESKRRFIDDSMQAETWFNSQEAHEAGLIDSIDRNYRLAAAIDFDLSRYHNAPETLKNTGKRSIIYKEPGSTSASAKISRMSNAVKALKTAGR